MVRIKPQRDSRRFTVGEEKVRVCLPMPSRDGAVAEVSSNDAVIQLLARNQILGRSVFQQSTLLNSAARVI
jgi:hypothetical protein